MQASVEQLSRARVRLLVQGDGFVSDITDDLDRFSGPNQVHAAIEVGSVAGGLRGRINLGGGLALLGGFSVGEEDYQDIAASNELTGSLALRYAPSSFGASRPFFEVGALAGGTHDLTMRRTYANGVGTAVGQGTAGYSNSAFWGRAGWIWDRGAADEVGAYVEYGEVRQDIGGYFEKLSNIDPFEALVGHGWDSMQVGKLGVRLSHDLAGGWELFGGLVAAHAFGQGHLLPVDVDGFGPVLAGPVGAQTWLEYRARIGHSVTTRSSLNLFVSGIAGTSTVGDSVHVGVDYRVVF